MVYLFENEVPEIQEGTVKIVAVSREANPPSRAVGPRTKVAVDSECLNRLKSQSFLTFRECIFVSTFVDDV